MAAIFVYNFQMVLDIDLNGPPRVEDLLVIDDAIGVNTHLELGLPQLQVTANSDSIDDEVVICSPRSFAEVCNLFIIFKIFFLMSC